MTQPNCIYGDASIDDAEHTFFRCERWRLKKWNVKVTFCAFTIENFSDVILSIEENWNSLTSYTELLLKSMKFYLDERTGMGI